MLWENAGIFLYAEVYMWYARTVCWNVWCVKVYVIWWKSILSAYRILK